MDLASTRGEAILPRPHHRGRFFAREPFLTWYKTGVVRIMLQTSRQRNPKIPDVPTLFRASWSSTRLPRSSDAKCWSISAVGGFGAWPIIATPGSPRTGVAILRDGFGQTMKDRTSWRRRNGPLGNPSTNGETLASPRQRSHRSAAGSGRVAKKNYWRNERARLHIGVSNTNSFKEFPSTGSEA